MDDETLKKYAYVSISSYRAKAVKALKDEDKIPSVIARDSGIRINHISKVLKELKDCDVAVCLNEEDRKNRVYRLTDLGQEIADNLD
ncbi:transcriptional regulator [Methanobrevibacter sp.]|uniref:transcriptional regulator n=1 Tax=Methanobrevibacter sp. TaxID=66852 RepID=UPI00388D3D94